MLGYPKTCFRISERSNNRKNGLKSIFTKEYEILLQRLIAARRKAGVTQQELAVRLGKHQSFVSKYERRERRLDVVELIMVCRGLGVDAYGIVREIEARLSSGSSSKAPGF